MQEPHATSPEPRTTSLEPRPAPAAPVQAGERVELIDVIRGVAVFGILLVNMGLFKTSIHLRMLNGHWFVDPLSQAIQFTIRFVAEGKFIALFSMLFGLGLAIQMERAEARGAPFVRLYVRRLLVLLGFGLAHAFFIWWGDILAMYAAFGFVLILFRKRKPTTLLVWTLILLGIPTFLMVLATGAVTVWKTTPEGAEQAAQQFESQRVLVEERVEVSRDVYANGNFEEVTRQRVRDTGTMWSMFWIWGPMVLGYFLIGLNLGRQRFFHRIDEFLPRIRKLLYWFGAIGIAGSFGNTVMLHLSGPMEMSSTMVSGVFFGSWGNPCLGLFYACSIILLYQRETWRRALAPLGAVGRMALTNYILHSVICTLVFYGYGLGLFGKVAPLGGVVLTLAIYAFQIPLSVWWLRRFRFGPLEWVWRSLTYLRPQPMRR